MMKISPLISHRKFRLYKLRLPNNHWINLTYNQIKKWNKPYKDAYFSICCYRNLVEFEDKVYEKVMLDEKLKDKNYMFQDIFIIDYDYETKKNILKGDKVMKSMDFKLRYILQTSPRNFQWCYEKEKVYLPDIRSYVKNIANTLKKNNVKFDGKTLLNIHNVFRQPLSERILK